MRIGFHHAAEVLNLTAHVTLDAHPLIGIVGAVIGIGVDDHRPRQEGRRHLERHRPVRTRQFLPTFDHLSAPHVQRIQQFGVQQGAKVAKESLCCSNGLRHDGHRPALHGHFQGRRVDLPGLAAKELLAGCS